MYTCGPSIYLLPHIGNYRTFLFEDVLQRYLEYSGYKVERLMTLTDVEDKAIAEAEKRNETLRNLTEQNSQVFFNDMELLRMKRPDYTPRSSTTVDQAVKLIEILLRRGYAYWHFNQGRRNVYYDSLKFRGFGKLSRIDTSKWPTTRRRFHRDTYPGTPWNKGDFILWHGYKQDDKTFWDTPIGKGRPAWNVQDAGMVFKCLGPSVDIACGGTDNLVRHHDYTLAISEAASGIRFSRYWLHVAHLFVNGKKMSKSRGNIYYPKDLIQKGFGKDKIRFVLMSEHYRKRLNFNFRKLQWASERLDTLKQMLGGLLETENGKSGLEAKQLIKNIKLDFENNMNHDLSVNLALGQIEWTIHRLDRLRRNQRLGTGDAKTAIANLHDIDEVCKVLF